MIFHDYTLQADGAIRSHRRTETDSLEPAAVQVFRKIVLAEDFHGPIHTTFPDIKLRWSSSPAGALATFSAADQMLTTSVLARIPESSVFNELAKLLGSLNVTMPDTYFECPAIVSIVWPTMDRENLMLVADMETCLAAAYFTAGGAR